MCEAKVEVVGALGGGEQKAKAAAAAPSPALLMPLPSPPKQQQQQQQHLPSDMHLSVPRLLDAFLQPLSPKPVQQQPLLLPRRLSADEQQQNAGAKLN